MATIKAICHSFVNRLLIFDIEFGFSKTLAINQAKLKISPEPVVGLLKLFINPSIICLILGLIICNYQIDIPVPLLSYLQLSVLAKTMCVFSSAFPTAAIVPILTEQEGKNVEFASMILLLSTVLSMVTIPIIIEFTKMVFGQLY